MSILRDIHILVKPLFDGSDDINPLGEALSNLTVEEREEWNREYDIFKKYIPEFGSGDAGYDAAEKEIMDTLPANFISKTKPNLQECKMTSNVESIYWMSNKEWYTVVNDEFVLTDKAPKRARDSFELWENNKLN